MNSLLNSQMGEMISKTDEQALAYLKNIESNVTVDSIELVLNFDESEWMKGGKYRRSIKLDQVGSPESFEGDEITIKKYLSNEEKEMGFLATIGKNTKDPQ